MLKTITHLDSPTGNEAPAPSASDKLYPVPRAPSGSRRGHCRQEERGSVRAEEASPPVESTSCEGS